MSVLAVTLNSIEGSRKEKIDGKISIQSSPTIKDIKETKIAALNKDALDIEFEYSCNYTKEGSKKSLGSLKMGGNVIFISKDNKKVLDDWKKKKLSTEIAVPVLNAILRKCVTRSMSITEELQLPSPVNLPKVSAGDAVKK